MKRYIVIALLFSFFSLHYSASEAKPVDMQTASRVAQAVLNKPVVGVARDTFNEFYLFTAVDGKGFVLVSADDCVRPVLGYSRENVFMLDEMPVHVRLWLEGYAREIASLRAADAVPSEVVSAEWNAYLNGTCPKSGEFVVEPLLTTTWNQAPLYNLLCPYDIDDSAYSVTGCTATATAQIMKYWNHPEVGWGSRGYNHNNYGWLEAHFDTTHYRWSLMPDALTSLSDSAEIMAVAELMYHVGVATNMNYSPSGSGAAVNSYGYFNYPSAENALKTYFKYNSMLMSIYKYEHSDTEWDDMIATEIEASRPVLYAGYDSAGGHAFVLDGIDSTGLFHINWGWGGAYDGYYTIDSLSPGAGGIGGNATYTFNINNSAVIGIVPAIPSSDSVAIVDMRFDSLRGTVTGNGTYTPFVDYVTILAHASEGYRFSRWQSGNNDDPLNIFVTGDITDSAIFESIVPCDTVGYCGDNYSSAWHDDYSDTTEWGIRIPPVIRQGNRKLTAVQYMPYQQGDLTLNIYVGDTIDESNPVYSVLLEHYVSDSLRIWNTHRLTQPIMVGDDDVVWVTLRAIRDGYPATMSRYRGCSDGVWYRLPQGWRTYDEYGVYYSWMLRALFEERPVRISVESNLTEGGMVEGGISVTGDGEYNVGDTACLFVDEGISFAWGWGEEGALPFDMENPKCFVATQDTTLHVWFHYCIGIDEIENSRLKVETSGLTVTVENPDGLLVSLYDIQGRQLSTFNIHHSSFTFPASGVYFLNSVGLPSRKIVITR